MGWGVEKKEVQMRLEGAFDKTDWDRSTSCHFGLTLSDLGYFSLLRTGMGETSPLPESIFTTSSRAEPEFG